MLQRTDGTALGHSRLSTQFGNVGAGHHGDATKTFAHQRKRNRSLPQRDIAPLPPRAIKMTRKMQEYTLEEPDRTEDAAPQKQAKKERIYAANSDRAGLHVLAEMTSVIELETGPTVLGIYLQQHDGLDKSLQKLVTKGLISSKDREAYMTAWKRTNCDQQGRLFAQLWNATMTHCDHLAERHVRQLIQFGLTAGGKVAGL